MIITKAPLRMSFLGGGSDFPAHFNKSGGAVLGTAIDKYVYVTVAELNEKIHGFRYKLGYRKTELVSDIEEIQHPAIREAIRAVCPDRSLEMQVIADLPAKTGLGSSSTFVTAVLQSLHAFNNELVSTEQLAKEAIELERYVLNEAGGYQDQVFAAYGKFNLIEFSAPGQFRADRLPLSQDRLAEIQSHCLLLYTGVDRESYVVLKEQVKRNGNGKNAARLKTLADLARAGAEYLCGTDSIENFGELLHEGWELKKSLADVSLPCVDALYAKARKMGAKGGKILGAGQGGFLLLWANPEVQEKVLEEVDGQMVHLPISGNASGSSIIHAA